MLRFLSLKTIEHKPLVANEGQLNYGSAGKAFLNL